MALRDLFVKQVDDYPASHAVLTEDVMGEDTLPVNVEGVDGSDTFLQEVYENNNLSDTSRSIEKIGEILGTLPKEMPKDTAKATIAGMLGVFGLTMEELIADASLRKDTVNLAAEQIVAEKTADIEVAKEAIEEAKKRIEDMGKVIASSSAEIETISKMVRDENARIDELLSYV